MNNNGILGCGNIKAKIAETVNLMDDVDLFAGASNQDMGNDLTSRHR